MILIGSSDVTIMDIGETNGVEAQRRPGGSVS